MTQLEVAILSVKVTLLSVVVGTVVTFIGIWINNRKADKLAVRTHQADYLRMQIEKLYGPLVFFAELSELFWSRHEEIGLAYDEYFKTRYGTDKFSQEMTEVIQKKNLWGERIVRNNQEIVPILKTYWGLLDADDVELVKQYLLDTSVQDVESNRESPSLPAEFYLPLLGLKGCLGPKFIRRDGFVLHLREKLASKQSTLSGLLKTAKGSAGTAR